MKVIFDESDMRDIRDRIDEIEAKRASDSEEVAEEDFSLNELGTDSDGTEDSETIRLDAGETLDEDEELTEEEARERLADGESVAMWEVEDES